MPTVHVVAAGPIRTAAIATLAVVLLAVIGLAVWLYVTTTKPIADADAAAAATATAALSAASALQSLPTAVTKQQAAVASLNKDIAARTPVGPLWLGGGARIMVQDGGVALVRADGVTALQLASGAAAFQGYHGMLQVNAPTVAVSGGTITVQGGGASPGTNATVSASSNQPLSVTQAS
jgi:hypothetical protein